MDQLCVCFLCFVFFIFAETDSGIFRQILKGKLDFESDPWPQISESAKDLIRKMLDRSPRQRITAHEVLCESYIGVWWKGKFYLCSCRSFLYININYS